MGTERNKVQIDAAIIAFQIIRHERQTKRPRVTPTRGAPSTQSSLIIVASLFTRVVCSRRELPSRKKRRRGLCQYENDSSVCRSLSDVNDRRRCWASAFQRYAQCLGGNKPSK